MLLRISNEPLSSVLCLFLNGIPLTLQSASFPVLFCSFSGYLLVSYDYILDQRIGGKSEAA